jgi:hypothetical protein
VQGPTVKGRDAGRAPATLASAQARAASAKTSLALQVGGLAVVHEMAGLPRGFDVHGRARAGRASCARPVRWVTLWGLRRPAV